ncbi:MAG: hypothetical protein KAW51_04650 [Candidatus Lokiarchaeota archaeon]|nr:hypothetical protein [Candidatus Lokiarchaeota archaeon]
MEYIERNYKILEKRMIEQMETSLDYGKSLIDSELDTGALNFVVKPIVKSFYKYWSDNEAKKGTLEQIKITLDSAKELVKNGDSSSKEQIEKVINKNFPIYLKNDQTDIQCRKNHQNHKKLKDVTKKCFITQVEESILFLNIKDNVNNYNELSRAAFKSKENAYQALKRQLDYNEEGINIVEQDDSILKVPFGKNIILKVLRAGFELTKKNLIEDLDEIFN